MKKMKKKIIEICKCMENSKIIIVICQDNILAVIYEKKIGIEFEIMTTGGIDFFLPHDLYL